MFWALVAFAWYEAQVNNTVFHYLFERVLVATAIDSAARNLVFNTPILKEQDKCAGLPES